MVSTITKTNQGFFSIRVKKYMRDIVHDRIYLVNLKARDNSSRFGHFISLIFVPLATMIRCIGMYVCMYVCISCDSAAIIKMHCTNKTVLILLQTS